MMEKIATQALERFPAAKYIQIYKGTTLVGGVARQTGEGVAAFQALPWFPPAQYRKNYPVYAVSPDLSTIFVHRG